MSRLDVLIIDDEPQIQKLLQITLNANGFKVRSEGNGKSGLVSAKKESPDVILLDIGLPDKSGHEVLTELRHSYTGPIIILSVQNSEEDIVKALNNGANDYVSKPFRSGELIARIQANVRKSVLERNQVISDAHLSIDLLNRVVKREGVPLKLTQIEYKLLSILAENAGRVITHQQLLKEVWGISYTDQTQYLRVFVAQLRKKIEKDPNSPKIIITESGVGYRFVLDSH